MDFHPFKVSTCLDLLETLHAHFVKVDNRFFSFQDLIIVVIIVFLTQKLFLSLFFIYFDKGWILLVQSVIVTLIL